MVFEEFESPPRDHACGAVFLRGQGGTRVKAIHGVRQAQEEMGELVVEARLPRPGQTHGTGYEGDGYVIVRHPSTEVVEKALSRLLRIVTVELE
jgi:hypothetical protein